MEDDNRIVHPPPQDAVPQAGDAHTHLKPDNDQRFVSHPNISCVTCRRRKVKCDKQVPCSNCTRGLIVCQYARERGPRRRRALAARKNEIASIQGADDLLARIYSLEEAILKLKGSEDDGTGDGSQKRPEHGANNGDHSQWPKTEDRLPSPETEKQFGRLMIGEKGAKTRYGSSSLWAYLSEQVEDMKDIFIESDSDEDDPGDNTNAQSYSPLEYGTGSSSSTTIQPNHQRHQCHGHQEFLFGYSSLAVDMRSLHPTPEKILFLWGVYKDAIDPIIKIAHVPTTENLILKLIREERYPRRRFPRV